MGRAPAYSNLPRGTTVTNPPTAEGLVQGSCYCTGCSTAHRRITARYNCCETSRCKRAHAEELSRHGLLHSAHRGTSDGG
ncbi:hypothetical protein NDU88_011776 [Pleurodeles waltl]|uniref:C2H2-type domain-containing protein n=1 Tax=Pleurodeles waltl TaxID=8319 RepID=A0AAV7R4E0_PLEWA|nr:hypothetical protein NDU88_011776 [Pleurodeles waltl]